MRREADAGLAIRPGFAELLYWRAIYSDDDVSRLEDLDRAIALQPDFADALAERGSLRRGWGDLELVA